MKTLALVLFLTLSACSQNVGFRGLNAPAIVVTTQPATPGECPTGGSQVHVGDQVVVICNGDVGASGPKGDTGASGAPGSPGSNGSSGERGRDGAPGSQITIVQFCVGATSYPSSFVEIGFCINDNIYAVYSEHDGFMTYVPPGMYSSNAHNSNCTFTVHEHCQVTH